MIFSKANLVAVDIARADRGIPALDNLHLLSSGGTVAANGSCVLAVSPLGSERRSKIPLNSTTMFTSGETVSSETVREVLKGMPRDTLFAGTLENCDYSSGRFTLTDGKRHRTIAARTYPRDYINFKGIFQRVGKSKVEKRVAVNLRRFVDLLEVIDKMFPDSSNSSVVYLEFTSENDVVVRGEDIRGGQRAVGVIRSYTAAGTSWPAMDSWENELFTMEKEDEICDSKANASDGGVRKINKIARPRKK